MGASVTDWTTIPDDYLSKKIQRVWPTAIVVKLTNGQSDRYYIRNVPSSVAQDYSLNDPTKSPMKNRFIEASENINAIVRAERAKEYKVAHSDDYPKENVKRCETKGQGPREKG